MQPVKGLTLEKGEGGEEKREKKRAILNETASITWGSSFHKEMTRYTPFLRDDSSLRQSHSVLLCREFQLARDAIVRGDVFFFSLFFCGRDCRDKKEERKKKKKGKKEGGHHRQTEKLGQIVKIEPTKLEGKRRGRRGGRNVSHPLPYDHNIVIWNESSISESVAICRTLFA